MRGGQEMARVEKVVIDASVAIKWYNTEADTEKALSQSCVRCRQSGYSCTILRIQP